MKFTSNKTFNFIHFNFIFLLASFKMNLLISLICFSLVYLFLNVVHAFQWNHNQPRSTGAPWPLPQLWRSSRIQFELKPNRLRITSNAGQCDVLKDAIRRYQKLIFLSAVYLNRDHVSNDIVDSLGETVPAPSPVTDPIESWSNDSISLKELLITVDRPDRCLYPQAGDDESYRLEIGRPTNGEGGNRSESIRLQATARIRSVSVWGALRALETFAQLVQVDGKREKLLVNATRIADWPAMSHRGILVDSSSHFIPLRTLLALLDAMEANKLNVLHWSVGGGSVSWPLISRATARLSLLGSFSPKHTYSRSDVFTLVERARMRGIRIVPELAVTGNAIALQRSFPHLIVCCSATDNHVDSTLDEPDTPDSVEDTLGDSLNDRFREHMAGTLTGDSTDDETIGNHVIDDIEDDSAATADHIHNKGFDRRRRRRRRQSPYELTASTLYAAESAAPDSQYPNRSVSIRSIRSSAPSSSSSSVLSSSASSSSASLPLSSEPIRSKHSNGEAGDDLESIEQCVLDPTRNGSFRLMQRVLREWRSQFVDEHVHVGLRRVRTDCWQQKPSVRRLMHALGVRSSIDLNHQFVVRLIEKAQSNRFKAIVWQDAFDQTFELQANVTIQLWKGRDWNEESAARLDSQSTTMNSIESWQQMARVLAKNGVQMILSSCWRLDSSGSSHWMSWYNCDPFSFTKNDADKQLMKGGETIVSGEFVDATNLLSLTWPKASAMAERLWTNPAGPTDRLQVFDRLQEQRCRLLLRGIPAKPIATGFCGSFEWDMH